MEILTTRRKHFKVKIDSVDNDFNKWPEEKQLPEEFESKILSEWQKNVENINKWNEEVWKKLSKKTKRKYKSDLIQYLQYFNHQAQHNQNKIKNRDTKEALTQTEMKVMINSITSIQNTLRAIIFNFNPIQVG